MLRLHIAGGIVIAVQPEQQSLIEVDATSATAGLLDDAQLILLYDYWRAKVSGPHLPSRRDINPVDLPRSVLPHLMLLDLEPSEGGLLIRFRLTGTHIDEALGRNPTGEVVRPSTVANDRYIAYIQALYEELAATGAPIYSENIFQLAGQSVPMLAKRLSLPLSNGGATVDMALVGAVFEYPALSGARYSERLQEFTETVRRRLPR
jgi:hypothetical protein